MGLIVGVIKVSFFYMSKSFICQLLKIIVTVFKNLVDSASGDIDWLIPGFTSIGNSVSLSTQASLFEQQNDVFDRFS